MKVLHCCLSQFYIDGYGYQENTLPRLNKEAGHDVMIVASTETYQNGKLAYLESSSYFTEYGVPIIRMAYCDWMIKPIAKKLRIHPAFKRVLNDFAPDVIMFHGTCGYEIKTAAEYANAHPTVKFYVDSHEDFNNSARTAFVRVMLYDLFYRPLIRHALHSIRKVLYITEETRAFCSKQLKIPDSKLEYYPLGGFLQSDEQYAVFRSEYRNKIGANAGELIILHTGKLGKRNRTLDLLTAFSQVRDKRLRLIITGLLKPEIETAAKRLIDSDDRIQYLGWVPVEELQKYLCCADMYAQPGSQSATMQQAVCCRCAILLYPYESHLALLGNNAMYVQSVKDIAAVFLRLAQDPVRVLSTSSWATEVAQQKLDYVKLAARLTE